VSDAREPLPPEVRDHIARLDITSQTLVEGLVSGLHRSPYHGFSVEFAQHREYAWGDEIKHVDWKVYGRTDRYYVKQYEEETNLHCQILLDVSESMIYKGARATITKFEYACTIAAAIAFLLIRQQDAAGLVLFDEEIRSWIPSSAHPAQLREMADAMSKVELRRESKIGGTFHRLAEEIRRRGLVVVVSDCFFPTDDLLSGIRHLRHKRHEVILFHVLDRDELAFPFEDNTLFKGLESMPELLTEPRSLRQAYLEAIGRFRERVEHGCQEARADYVLVDTSEPPAVLLSRYLITRARREGRGARA
jgi:uncharacterized protein (DUF58 family)